MTRPKVCFLGNCQAQAFQSLSGHLGLDIDVIALPPTFQINHSSQSLFEDAYSQADFIFHQRVDENFKIEFVRGNYIKSQHKSKSVSWPNIYFDGYFPGVRYVYSAAGQKLVGPLSEYHIPEIINGWKQGKPIDEVAAAIQEGSLFYNVSPVEDSLRNLATREVGLDCVISDYVRERFRSRRLFYSMNHPTNEMLAEMLHRLFSFAGIKFHPRHDIANYAYTLDQVILPIYGYFRKRYRPAFKEGDFIKSFVINADGSRSNVSLTWEEAVSGFYKLYDSVTYNM